MQRELPKATQENVRLWGRNGERAVGRMCVCVIQTHAVTYIQMKVFASQKFSYREEVHHSIAQTRETERLLWELALTKSVPRLSAQGWPRDQQDGNRSSLARRIPKLVIPSLHSFHLFSQLSIGREAPDFSLHRLEERHIKG